MFRFPLNPTHWNSEGGSGSDNGNDNKERRPGADDNSSSSGANGDSDLGRVLKFDPGLRKRSTLGGSRAGAKAGPSPQEKNKSGFSRFGGFGGFGREDDDSSRAAMGGGGHTSGSGRPGNRYGANPSKVKQGHSTRFKIFRALEFLGVAFVLVIVLRNCGLL